jgi:guanylate kinase
LNNQVAETLSLTKGLFIVVSAPSGTGKTSICRQVLKMFPNIRFSVSYTTRLPRPGEVDGRDYHFVSEESFKQRIDQGEFVEWAENYGHLYGTSFITMEEQLNKGIDVMLDVETRGAMALKGKYPGGVFVFILPPTLDELRTRLSRRGFETPGVIEARFNKAVDEIKEAFWYDYVIFNDKLAEAIDQLRSIYVAEKCSTNRLSGRVKAFLEQENR